MLFGEFQVFCVFCQIVLRGFIQKSRHFREFFPFELATLIQVQNYPKQEPTSEKMAHFGIYTAS
jgi:hypothetical protein